MIWIIILLITGRGPSCRDSHSSPHGILTSNMAEKLLLWAERKVVMFWLWCCSHSHPRKSRKKSTSRSTRWFFLWPFWDGENVTPSKVVGDLQWSGTKRSRLESPCKGSFVGFHVQKTAKNEDWDPLHSLWSIAINFVRIDELKRTFHSHTKKPPSPPGKIPSKSKPPKQWGHYMTPTPTFITYIFLGGQLPLSKMISNIFFIKLWFPPKNSRYITVMAPFVLPQQKKKPRHRRIPRQSVACRSAFEAIKKG